MKIIKIKYSKKITCIIRKWIIKTFSVGSNPKLSTVTSELILDSVERSHDRTQFSCVVSQTGSEVGRQEIQTPVNVQWKPEKTKIVANSAYLESNSVSIKCESKFWMTLLTPPLAGGLCEDNKLNNRFAGVLIEFITIM